MGSQNGKPVLRNEDIAALSKSSSLDENKIIEMFNTFIAENPKGKMKPKYFRELMTTALPKRDACKMEKHVFRIYDTNTDGFIDFEEFMIVFHIMSAGSNEEVLRKIFRVFDVNCDGTISKKEMTKLINDMYGILEMEDPNIPDKKSVVKKAFAEMDKDSDGGVSESEFIQSCLGQQQISRLLALKVIDILVGEK